jgi:iron complex outermembrane receptor protein
MSELINTNDNRATIRWKLLTGVSALALTACVSTAGVAYAEDTDRPMVWIDLGGEMQMMQGLSDPFTAPFMSAAADIGLDKGKSFITDQRPVRFAFGVDGKITFQPKDSDWVFSAGVRYGRAHAKRHVHVQADGPEGYRTVGGHKSGGLVTFNGIEPFRDVDAPSSERHMVLDFSAGRDVGIGLLGHDGTSTISAGVRIAQFREGATVDIYARPIVNLGFKKIGVAHFPTPTFAHQYTMTAEATRSFKGVGPSLSWNAAAGIAGNAQDGELMVDWGIDAALLFGRQKAKTDHATQAYQLLGAPPKYIPQYKAVYHHGPYHSTRSKNVTVPDVGAFAGLSFRYPNAKVSIGYRYDMFFKAMDAGIDARHASNLTFNGPYASISIGLP